MKNSHIEWYLKMSVCQLRGKIVPSKVEVYQLRGKMVTQDGTLTHSVLSEQKNSHTYTSFQKVWLNHNQYHFNWAHFGNTELFILLLTESMHYCHFNSSKEPPLPTFSTQGPWLEHNWNHSTQDCGKPLANRPWKKILCEFLKTKPHRLHTKKVFPATLPCFLRPYNSTFPFKT